VARDWRDDRIAEIEKENAELRAQLAEALKRIAELEEKLGKSSRNSSKPPSSDTPAQVAERRKKAAAITNPGGGRKPGGQPGHEKFSRQLVPPEQVNRHVDCIPEHCERCSKRLRGRDPAPHLHQVFHLPEVRPLVDQYAQHALRCSDKECGHVTVGKLPDGVPHGAFGPSVIATVALLLGVCRVGRRTVQELLADLFHLPMSLGGVVGCQDIASAALQSPVDEAKQAASRAAVKHSDETSWREGPKRAKVWLWVMVTKTLVVFQIHKERSAQAARDLLGRARGVLISDRYSSYSFWPLWLRQVCWAHLIRDFVAIAERGGESQRIGDGLLDEARRLFAWWHRVRDGTLKRATFQVYVRNLQKRVSALLEQGSSCAHPSTARTCAQITKVWPALWLFVEREGIEPTNNRAERAVRHPVLWRKSSGGTHSELGSRFAERILTVVATLRLQNRNTLSFLRAACEAHLSGSQVPSLLSAPATANAHQLRQAA
jgi:transposase